MGMYRKTIRNSEENWGWKQEGITLNPKLDREKEEIVTGTWKELSGKKNAMI